MSPESSAPDRPVDCYSCRHFKVTWQPSTPYLCRAMGFRSRVLPSVEVFRADGAPCRAYQPREDLDASSPTPEPSRSRFSRRV